MRSKFIPMLIYAFMTVGCFAPDGLEQRYYPDYKSANTPDGIIHNGWMYSDISQNIEDIHFAFNVDTSRSYGKMRTPDYSFLEKCSKITLAEMPLPPMTDTKDIAWWPKIAISSKDASRPAFEVRSCTDYIGSGKDKVKMHNYFIIQEGTEILFLWSELE